MEERMRLRTRNLMALVVGLVLSGPSAAWAGSEARLTGFDVLGRVGKPVALRAKLESKGMIGINPDVEKEPLDFFLMAADGKELEEARFLGSAPTDDDGIASAEWTPEQPGTYLVEGRVRRGSEYVALPAVLTVAVPAAERPIILVQIDGTVSQATNVKMFRGTENEEIPAVEGAAQVLGTLGQHYQLVYLTDLELAFTEKFKAWLRLRGLPDAPIIFWELFERSLSHATYMTKLVASLRKDFPQAIVGLGGSEADAEAYITAGMAGIVLGEEADELGPPIVTATRWEQVLGHVALLYRSKGLIEALARGDSEAREAALNELSVTGSAGIGYVHRFRQHSDPDVSAAATLVAAKLQAIEAFTGALDCSSANDALTSLLAAWHYGEPAVVARLYRDPATGFREPIPVFHRCEMVSRNEPEPGKVVFRVRLVPPTGDPSERELILVEGEDRTWKVDGGAF